MIPAKISNLNPVQATYYRLPEPEASDYRDFDCIGLYATAYRRHLSSKVIADVENVEIYTFDDDRFFKAYVEFDNGSDAELSLNQPVFIELTGEGKCKIVKL